MVIRLGAFRRVTVPLGVLLVMAVGGVQSETRSETDLSRLKIPETAEEHLGLAKDYRQRAAQLRLDAKLHREMKAAYGRAVSQAPKGTVRPWWAKQQAHCERLARQAEALATETEELAEFHKKRADEFGKPSPSP